VRQLPWPRARHVWLAVEAWPLARRGSMAGVLPRSIWGQPQGRNPTRGDGCRPVEGEGPEVVRRGGEAPEVCGGRRCGAGEGRDL
jgi:hypothetical protein